MAKESPLYWNPSDCQPIPNTVPIRSGIAEWAFNAHSHRPSPSVRHGPLYWSPAGCQLVPTGSSAKISKQEIHWILGALIRIGVSGNPVGDYWIRKGCGAAEVIDFPHDGLHFGCGVAFGKEVFGGGHSATPINSGDARIWMMSWTVRVSPISEDAS